MTDQAGPWPVYEFLARWWTQGSDRREPDEFLVSMEQYLEAFVELDALSVEQAATWLARLRIAGFDDGRILAEAADRVLSRLENTFAQAPEPLIHGSEDHLELNGVLAGAFALGTVDQDARRAWHARLAGMMRAAAPMPPPSETPERVREMEAMAAPRKMGPPRRVIAGPTERKAGMRIASVELGEEALVVRWHFLSVDGGWPERISRYAGPLQLTDDVGTAYLIQGSGGSRMSTSDGDAAVIVGDDRFVPAPPPGARSLNIGYGHEHYTITLDAIADY